MRGLKDSDLLKTISESYRNFKFSLERNPPEKVSFGKFILKQIFYPESLLPKDSLYYQFNAGLELLEERQGREYALTFQKQLG